jgi:hypothetical protein
MLIELIKDWRKLIECVFGLLLRSLHLGLVEKVDERNDKNHVDDEGYEGGKEIYWHLLKSE